MLLNEVGRRTREVYTPYTLYYDPKFKFDQPGVQTFPGAIDNIPAGYWKRDYMLAKVEEVKKSYQECGKIYNPAVVTLRTAKDPKYPGMRLHPGQTRCRALRELGVDTIPVLIVDTVGDYWQHGGTALPSEAAKALFSDDLSLEFQDHGWLVLTRIKPRFRGERDYEGVRTTVAG